jgi:hypothetical protein
LLDALSGTTPLAAPTEVIATALTFAAFKVTVPVYPLTDCTGAADAAPDDVTYPTSFVN